MDFTVTFAIQVTADTPEQAAAYALADLRDESIGPWTAQVSCSRGKTEVVAGEVGDGVEVASDAAPGAASPDHTAFEVTAEDVESVLRANIHLIANSNGVPIGAMAEALFASLDIDRVEKAALNAADDLEGQTAAAHDEITLCLIEGGQLKS